MKPFWKGTAAVTCAVLVALPAMAADITPGYTFTSGEQNVTHTKLNNSASGTINTTFYSGKSSAGANPATTMQLLLRNTSSDLFVRSTLAEAVFDHSAFGSARTLLTAPAAGDTFTVYDESATAYRQVALSNLWLGTAFGSVATNEDRLMLFDFSAGTMHGVTLSNLIASAMGAVTNLGSEEFLVLSSGRELRRMRTAGIITNATDGSALGNWTFPLWDGSELRESSWRNAFQGHTAITAATNHTIVMVDPTDSTVLKEMSVRTLGSNVLAGYVAIEDQQANAETGGGLTNSWSVRRLNTITTDVRGLVTGGPGATNAFTLAAGVYRYRLVAPALMCGAHQVMLTNETLGTVVGLGQVATSNAGDNTTSTSEACGLFTNSAANVLAVRHRVQTQNNTDGGGQSNFWGGLNIYTRVEFWKVD